MVEVRIYNCLRSLDMGENLTRVGVSLLEPMYPLPHTGRRFPFTWIFQEIGFLWLLSEYSFLD